MRRCLTRDARRQQLEARFIEQAGLCFYCLRECFLTRVETFAAAAGRLGVALERIRLRIASREHLKKRQDGGGDEDWNIVMACVECNSTREDRSVLKHVKFCRQKHRARELVFVDPFGVPA